MANTNQTSVVMDLRRKTTDPDTRQEVWASNPIGSCEKYIKSLPGSGNNNLEEELLMGVSKITYTKQDAETGAITQTVEYRTENRAVDFYKIIKEIAGDQSATVYIDDDEIVFTKDSGMYFVDSTLTQDSYDAGMVYDESLNAFMIRPSEILELDNLYYVDANGVESLISSKKSTQSIQNGKTIIKEVITNNL